MSKRTVAIVLFENAEELDFAGPWEVFAYLRKLRPELCEVFTVSEKGGEIACAKGLRVLAQYSFDAAPPADVYVIPGGVGRKVEVNNPKMIEFVQRAARQAELMTSVCTGAFILYRAGLLQDKPATTYWNARDELRAAGHADVRDDRYVDAGNVITASGVSAGIDMSLYVLGRLWGPEVARIVQRGIEYFPQPPYQDVPIPPPCLAMHSKHAPRNRLAKVLPEEWREMLLAQGVPRRKYTAVVRAELVGGRVIEEMIVEQGWIIATNRDGLAGTFEQRIDFDPRQITRMEIVQVV